MCLVGSWMQEKLASMSDEEKLAYFQEKKQLEAESVAVRVGFDQVEMEQSLWQAYLKGRPKIVINCPRPFGELQGQCGSEVASVTSCQTGITSP